MNIQFFRCPVCGNIIFKVVDSTVVPSCCGQPMQLLVPNEVDASHEKHVPFIVESDAKSVKVQIGEKLHPMTPEHHIQFLAVETESGVQINRLSPTAGPHACFCFRSKLLAVYSYCNLHGLWKLRVM